MINTYLRHSFDSQKIRIAAIFLFATFLTMLFMNPLAQAEQKYHRLKRVSVGDLVFKLAHEDGFRIHFEGFPNKPEDAISVNQQIEIIEAIPFDQRTKRETSVLKFCREMSNKGDVSEQHTVNWRLKRFDFDYPLEIENVSNVLDAIVRKDRQYTWKRISQSYVVYPKRNSFNKPIAPFAFQDVDLNQARAKIREMVIEPCNLNWIMVGVGLSQPIDKRKYTFSCRGEDAHTVLSRFAALRGPDIVWEALGTDKYTNFGFGNIPEKEKQQKVE